MKRVIITYHMRNGEEEAETCITLPMKDSLADELLEKQREYVFLRSSQPLHTILNQLAWLQGYYYAGFYRAEEDKRFAPVRCSQCGEVFTWQDLRDFRHMGEQYFKSGDEFMCPDCYADFNGLDLEDQVDVLLGKAKLFGDE